MPNGNITTVTELYIYVEGKFTAIEGKLDDIKSKPDKIGKWFLRIILSGVAIVQVFILIKGNLPSFLFT